MVKKNTIGSLLIKYGLITGEDLDESLALQKETGRRLGEILVGLGRITPQDIEWILSKQLDIPFIIVDGATVDKDLVCRFPKELLIKNRVLPMYETDEEIAIVTDDPFQTEVFHTIEAHSHKRVRLSAGDGEKIEEILTKIYRKEGVPELVSRIEEITEKIRHTSFYRIDFVMSSYGLLVNVYGAGILRNVFTSADAYNSEDIFAAFDALNLPFLYAEYENEHETFLAVYPLAESLDVPRYPVVLACYGLGIPGGTAFSDMEVHGLTGLFYSEEPVHGYSYLSMTTGVYGIRKTVYTVDSLPAGLKECYLKAFVPSRCSACNGTGCANCGELGLVFRKMEGVYSCDDIISFFKEGKDA